MPNNDANTMVDIFKLIFENQDKLEEIKKEVQCLIIRMDMAQLQHQVMIIDKAFEGLV